MPHFLKRRWYDQKATHVQVDVRGVWPSDTGARAAGPPGNLAKKELVPEASDCKCMLR